MNKQQRDRIDEMIAARSVELDAKWTKAHPEPKCEPRSVGELLAMGLHYPAFTKALLGRLSKDPSLLNGWRAGNAVASLAAKHCPGYKQTKAAYAKWCKARDAESDARNGIFQRLKDRFLFDGLDLARIMAEIRAVG